MDRRRLLALPLALAVSWATAACDVQVGQDGDFSLGVASGRAQDTWSRSYTLPAGGRFELINVNGRILAEPSCGETIEVSAERIAKASSDPGDNGVKDFDSWVKAGVWYKKPYH